MSRTHFDGNGLPDRCADCGCRVDSPSACEFPLDECFPTCLKALCGRCSRFVKMNNTEGLAVLCEKHREEYRKTAR